MSPAPPASAPLRVGRYVPVTAAAIALAGSPTDTASWLPRLDGALVTLGRTAAVDLQVLADADPDGAATIGRYWRAATRTAALAAGRPACPQAGVDVREVLLDATQRSSGEDRHDLVVEHAALVDTPGVGPIIDTLLSADPDHTRLQVLTRLQHGTVTVDGTQTTATMTIPTRTGWPAGLGGDLSPFELARTVVVTARHATWRRWCVRRLAAVTVTSIQRWPTPA